MPPPWPLALLFSKDMFLCMYQGTQIKKKNIQKPRTRINSIAINRQTAMDSDADIIPYCKYDSGPVTRNTDGWLRRQRSGLSCPIGPHHITLWPSDTRKMRQHNKMVFEKAKKSKTLTYTCTKCRKVMSLGGGEGVDGEGVYK